MSKDDIKRKKQKVTKVKQHQSRKTKASTKKYSSTVKTKLPKKKGLTKTQKERKLVQQQIRRIERKGYRVPDAFKEKVKTASYQTLHSIRRNKYEKLYNASTYLTPSGEIKQGRAKRGNILQPVIEKPTDINNLPQPETHFGNEEGFEEEEAARLAEFERMKDDPEYQQQLDIGNAYLNWIDTEIEQFANTGTGRFGEFFREVLDEEIDEYGLDKVLQSIANAPADFLAKAEAVMFYSGDQSQLRVAMSYLYQVIKGNLPDAKTNAYMDSLFESEYENFDFFRT